MKPEPEIRVAIIYSETLPGGFRVMELLLIEFQSWVDLYTAFASLKIDVTLRCRKEVECRCMGMTSPQVLDV